MPSDQIEIFVGLFRSLGLIAFVVLGYATAMRLGGPRIGRRVVIGLLFGFGGVVSMLDPIQLAPGVLFDARNILVALAGPFGGVAGAVIAAICVGLFRVWEGGVGATAGVVGIVIVALIGILFAQARTVRPSNFAGFLALGAATSVSLVCILFLPAALIWPVFQEIALPVVLTNLVGVAIAGEFLRREDQKLDFETSLMIEANTDPLTSLANRRVFDEKAPNLAMSCTASGNAYSVLFIDVDRFKLINDNWGHQVGDLVLARISDIIRAQTRRGDLVARYGGEEIAVLLPRSDAMRAVHVADRIRTAIEQHDFNVAAGHLPVTASVGVCTSPPEGGNKFETVLKAADDAVYVAKNLGRNRVETGILAAA